MVVAALILAGITTGSESCKKKNDNSNATARLKALDDYNNNYLPSAVTSVTWTGNSSTCTPGTNPDAVHQKVLQRINYYRRQVGLNDNIVFDTSWNRKCMEAALMMYSNGALNHYPPNTWKCYTADGATAAGKSNLGLGYNSTTALDGMMADPGSGNTACGHRRWILYSRAKTMGHGSTSGSMALWVIGGGASTDPPGMPEYTCWPPANYVPRNLVFARWSFSKPGADFTNAAVVMTDKDGNSVSCTKLTLANGYGDNTLVWEPSGVVVNSDADLTYHVTVSNVIVSSVAKSYSYTVTIFKP